MNMDRYSLTARWIFPVAQPPLEQGVITVHGENIISVESNGSCPANIDLGNVAVLPGLVNAHTHLDLSDALGRCPPTPDFVRWLRAVIDHRLSQTAADVHRAIEIGLAQCERYGTTLVGDIAANGTSYARLSTAPLRAVVFHELLGLTTEGAAHAVEKMTSWLGDTPPSRTCNPGISPHAPYSVNAQLLIWAARLAAEKELPLSMHVAETEAEVELLRTHSGPFVTFLKELGVWNEEGLSDSIEKVLEIIGTAGISSLVHGNYLENAHLPSRSTTNVFCPRTHAAFGHKPHPFRNLFDRGIRVALGTDSLASNPDLDILAEARFLHAKAGEVPGKTLLEMATLNGAAALGWDRVTGSLAAGKSADMVILPLPDADATDPHDLVFESSHSVKEVIYRGKLNSR